MDWNTKFFLIGILILLLNTILVISSEYDTDTADSDYISDTDYSVIQSTSGEIKEFSPEELGKLYVDELSKGKNEISETGGFLSKLNNYKMVKYIKETIFSKRSEKEKIRKEYFTHICEVNVRGDVKTCAANLYKIFPEYNLIIISKVIGALRPWFGNAGVEESDLRFVVTFPTANGWPVETYCTLLNGINTVVPSNENRLIIIKMISSRSFKQWKRYFNRDVTKRFDSKLAIPKMMFQPHTIIYYDFYIEWVESTVRKFKIENEDKNNFENMWTNYIFGCSHKVIQVLVKLFVSLSLPEAIVKDVYNKMCLGDFYLKWNDDVNQRNQPEFYETTYESYHALDNFVNFAVNFNTIHYIIILILQNGYNSIKTIHEEKFTPDLKDNLVDMNEINTVISDCTDEEEFEEDEECILWGISSLAKFRETYKIGRTKFNEIRVKYEKDIKLVYLIGKTIEIEIEHNIQFIYEDVFRRLLHLLRNNSFSYNETLLISLSYSFLSIQKDAFDFLLLLHLYKYDELTTCIELKNKFQKLNYEEKLKLMKYKLKQIKITYETVQKYENTKV